MGLTNLEEQFTFYASYHHNGLNKLIHIICVWPILWSAFVLAEYIPFEAPAQINSIFSFIHPVNITFIVSVFYASVYVVMDRRAGSLAAALVFFCLITARKFYLGAEASYHMPAWQLATIIHVLGWVAQFIGHGAFEGRSPALLDNLIQAIVMAPLFVLLEVLFPLGYRKDFQKRVWAKVEKEIAKFKSGSKAPKKAAKGKKKFY